MNCKKLSTPYHPSSVLLHWLMLALFVFVYASIELRVLFEKGTAARDLMKTAHFTLGYFLIGAHAAAALFHHYILRDSTLRQMLPRRFLGAGAGHAW